MTNSRWAVVLAAAVTACATAQPDRSGAEKPAPSLRPTYSEGQELAYRISSSNRRPTGTATYEATARGVVERDAAGRFRETYAWKSLSLNGRETVLDLAASSLRQVVSLAPDHALALPDLSKTHPGLIGPMTDLMTFYADVWLALREPELQRAGGRAFVAHKRANSWADGSRTLLGQDAVDFEIVLERIDVEGGDATLIVRHVPPKTTAIAIPAEWMREPVADAPNNWVQVVRTQGGKYRAAVGKETFDVEVHLRVADARIVSAVMRNPVDVLERECVDEALAQCEAPTRYQILRQVELQLVE
jgi:hypothetical protein